jgi:hypothetical protein
LNGTSPPVIDSNDLLETPEKTVEAFCEAVGIPFIKEALSWEPVPTLDNTAGGMAGRFMRT